MAITDELNEELEAQRQKYFEARLVLSQKIGSGPDDELIGYAKTIGVPAALAEFYNDPGAFGFDGDLEITDLEEMKPTLEKAYRAEIEMMRLVNARETALCSVDPDHQRIRIHLGREYLLDRSNKKMRFLDDNQTLEEENSRGSSRSM